MTLRHTTISAGGELSGEVVLDSRVCECCQTSAAQTSEGAVVVYRDRSEKEVRDISIVRFSRGRWTEPEIVHGDGWEIEGCPVNGPSVAASGRRVAVAWFTAAKDTPRVKIAFSEDAGASFGQPVQVDDGSPIGRVEVLMLRDGSAFVVWLERADKGAEVRARRGDIAPLELRAEIFERLYRDDFDAATLARMRAALLAPPRGPRARPRGRSSNRPRWARA